MSLQDVEVKIEYRSLIDNVAKEFYIPILQEACHYKRAVGFFSSSSLVEISKGISELVKNSSSHGKPCIQLIASPKLSSEDIESIREGYRAREKVIECALYREMTEPQNQYQEKQLNYLANLIADGILDIKIAVTLSNAMLGMYHEKMGIISDSEGNRIAFSGSMNESINAFVANYETIDVFKSWTGDLDRVIKKDLAFDSMWADTEPGIKVYQFEQVTDEFISRYKKDTVVYSEYKEPEDQENIYEDELTFFRTPSGVEYYDYQKDAMDAWIKNGCCGTYDMATGTGKTFTALGSLTKLSQLMKEQIAVVIVAPYIHLVEQWVEDIEFFNVKPIIAYGYQGNRWRSEFKNAILAYNRGIRKNFCIITTNSTFISDDFQNLIKGFRKNYCFVADEAHNLGAENTRKCLPKTARYRLALSATLERHRDENGTLALRQYFGNDCINFSLKDAIDGGFLTPYYYYPCLVYLDPEELEDYNELTRKIIRCGGIAETGETSDYVEKLLIRRARIIAGCKSKIDKLIEVIEPYKEDYHMLVYCGATSYDRTDMDDDDQVRQIDEVNRRLYTQLGMKVCKFTSSEDPERRIEIKKMFVDESLQVITAIKCLDEGVNIPAINRAFILASSSNPKEYIQRRGRVLRKAEGKEYAEIYDFVTLPRKLEDVKYLDEEERKRDLNLVYREFERMMDFANTSSNPTKSDFLIAKIQETYRINKRAFKEESE